MHQIIATSNSGEDRAILTTKAVLIDTDLGDDIDDALALALALQSPEIALQGITTVFGDTYQRAYLAAHLLQVFGHDHIPVAAGVGTPLQPRHRPSGVPQASVIDQYTKLPALSTLSGPELIAQTALAHHGQLTLLCIGPLTNIATALTIDPHVSKAIGKIILMGGTSGLPWPEWNVRNDAKAAQIVLSSGIPVTLVGWNVTTRCQLQQRDIEQLRHNPAPHTQLLSQLIAVWQRHRPRWHPSLPYLHDPLTIVALCAPELLQFEDMMMKVLTHGPLKGFMVPRLMAGHRVHAAVNVQPQAAKEWVMQRLLSPIGIL